MPNVKPRQAPKRTGIIRVKKSGYRWRHYGKMVPVPPSMPYEGPERRIRVTDRRSHNDNAGRRIQGDRRVQARYNNQRVSVFEQWQWSDGNKVFVRSPRKSRLATSWGKLPKKVPPRKGKRTHIPLLVEDDDL